VREGSEARAERSENKIGRISPGSWVIDASRWNRVDRAVWPRRLLGYSGSRARAIAGGVEGGCPPATTDARERTYLLGIVCDEHEPGTKRTALTVRFFSFSWTLRHMRSLGGAGRAGRGGVPPRGACTRSAVAPQDRGRLRRTGYQNDRAARAVLFDCSGAAPREIVMGAGRGGDPPPAGARTRASSGLVGGEKQNGHDLMGSRAMRANRVPK
jgi:hypothetical protein